MFIDGKIFDTFIIEHLSPQTLENAQPHVKRGKFEKWNINKLKYFIRCGNGYQ